MWWATPSTLRRWTFISEHSASHYAHKERTTSFYSLWKSTWNQSHVECAICPERCWTLHRVGGLLFRHGCAAPSEPRQTAVVMVSTRSAVAEVLPQAAFFYESLPQVGAFAGSGDSANSAGTIESLQLIYWAKAQGFMFVWDLID